MTKGKLILISGAVVLIIIVIVVFYFGRKPSLGPGAKLEFWDAADEKSAWTPVIEEFNKFFGNIQISYVKKDPKTFEEELIKALAAGQGPDIFSFHNTWLPKYKDLIWTLPQDFKNQWGFELSQFRSTFAEVANQDFVSGGQIYALPIYIDTLALYYNRDFFDSRGIPAAPSTWEDFEKTAKVFTRKDESGNITRGGAAFGNARNVDKAGDIFSALTLQKGNDIIDRASKEILINKGKESAEALEFYTSFSDPRSQNYSWDLPGINSIDAFSQGKAAMMVNYSDAKKNIRQKSPTLNFAISSLPQFDPDLRKDYASYYGLAVTKKSRVSDQAWNFITFAASSQGSLLYINSTDRPPARRDLLGLKFDPETAVFARQTLSSKSWYQPDNEKIMKIFADMIESVVRGQTTSGKAIDLAASEISEIMR